MCYLEIETGTGFCGTQNPLGGAKKLACHPAKPGESRLKAAPKPASSPKKNLKNLAFHPTCEQLFEAAFSAFNLLCFGSDTEPFTIPRQAGGMAFALLQPQAGAGVSPAEQRRNITLHAVMRENSACIQSPGSHAANCSTLLVHRAAADRMPVRLRCMVQP